MTEIGVTTTNTHYPEDRSWLYGPHGTDPGTTPGVILDLSLFDKERHYPKGFIPSGIVLAKVTGTKRIGPYAPAATDGRQTAKGLLFGSLPARGTTGQVGGAALVHGFINPDRLPIKDGSGSLDDAARAALPLIHTGL